MSCDLLQSLKLNDDDEAASSTSKERLMKEYEAVMNDPKMAEALSNKIYSRELIQLVRDINKTFHLIPCPLSEEELYQLRIDLGSVPQYPPLPISLGIKSKISLYVQVPGNREKLINFLSDFPRLNRKDMDELTTMFPNKTSAKKHFNKMEERKLLPKPMQGSNKISTIIRLHRSPNPWKSSFYQPKTWKVKNLRNVEEVKKIIRSILNKITPTTYQELSAEVVNMGIWKHAEILSAVVDLIFAKAIEDQIFSGIYANLCLDLFNTEEEESDGRETCFLDAIAKKCQSCLTAIVVNCEEPFFEIEQKHSKSTEKLTLMEEAKAAQKRKCHGILRFFVHLCRVPILHFQTLQNCFRRLIKKATESEKDFPLMIEFAVFFVDIIGHEIIAKNPSESQEHLPIINGFVDYLVRCKTIVSNRLRILIWNLEELRDRSWKSARSNNGPKSLAEIAMEFQMEDGDQE